MLKRIMYSGLAVCFLFSNISCATIVSGKSQDLPVVTKPSGAVVTIGGMKQVSPGTFALDRREPFYDVKIEKEGFEPVEMRLKRGTNGWLWGNILFGGIIGLIIDFTGGAAYKFVPDELEVDLAKQQFGLNDLEGKDILFVRLVE